MRHRVALQRYLQRHIEPGLPDYYCATPRWRHALVIPAYQEPADLIPRLAELPRGDGKTLVLLVLNRPDSDPDAGVNAALRAAASKLELARAPAGAPRIQILNDHTDLYLHDMENLGIRLPAAQGVGLARKAGCDIILKWMSQGAIGGEWICCTDADARLPRDYFQRLAGIPQAGAAVYPFRHMPGPQRNCDEATARYELRLHHYVLGLEYAASPYAHHTLGSCLAIRAEQYAQVRGFPKRAGGEDFYLLNKLAKLAPVARLSGECIELQSRLSRRVPFGTGPAVEKIAAAEQPDALPLFYHPHCFAALRALLSLIPALRAEPTNDIARQLQSMGLDTDLALASSAVLHSMGLDHALAHCRRQGKSPEQFLRQFHQWFDGFRTLKFIHALRDAGLPEQALTALDHRKPQLWPEPGTACAGVETLRDSINRHWGWTRQAS